MKKSITALSLSLASLIAALCFTGCAARQKFDFTNVNSLADLNGAIIAAQTGTFHLNALKEQTTGVDVREYADFTQLLVALNSGAIDGHVAEEPTAFSIIAQNSGLGYVALKNNDTGFNASVEDTGIAVAFRTGSPLVAQVNAALATIRDDTKSALMQQAVTMSAEKTKALTEPIALSYEANQTTSGTLKVAMECGYDPFNWSQTTDVNGAVKIQGSTLYANGYDVQIAKFIANALGMQLEIYAAEWESLISGVQAGTYDAIIAGMSPTAKREEQVDFTDCYYNSNLVIIYKK